MGELSFDHLLMRLSRSHSGPRKPAMEYPALLFVFDILSDEAGNLLTGEHLSKRRSILERFAEEYLDENGTIRLSPATREVEVARKWLDLAGLSLDGVVAKRLDLPYETGISGACKRSSDCVRSIALSAESS
jgi:ATP-dependent DNA ligase